MEGIVKPLVAGVAALLLAVTLGFAGPAVIAGADAPAVAPAGVVLPEAPKKTPKAKATPKPTPTPTPASTPTVRPRSAAEIEGDRWVQIATIAGGGMLGCVALFFAIGALLRRKPRQRG